MKITIEADSVHELLSFAHSLIANAAKTECKAESKTEIVAQPAKKAKEMLPPSATGQAIKTVADSAVKTVTADATKEQVDPRVLQISKLIGELVVKKGRDVVVATLAPFGAKRGGEIQPKDYDAFIAAATAALV